MWVFLLELLHTTVNVFSYNRGPGQHARWTFQVADYNPQTASMNLFIYNDDTGHTIHESCRFVKNNSKNITVQMLINEAHCVKELISMLISNQNFHIFKMSWAEIWTCLFEDKQQLFTLNQRHLILTTELILTSATAPRAGSPRRCIWAPSDYITPVKEKKQRLSHLTTL